MGACGNRRAYSVFCRKNMKLAAGLIADRVYKFVQLFPLPSVMAPAAVHIVFYKTTVCPSIIVGFGWEVCIYVVEIFTINLYCGETCRRTETDICIEIYVNIHFCNL